MASRGSNTKPKAQKKSTRIQGAGTYSKTSGGSGMTEKKGRFKASDMYGVCRP